jgi:hypothetical protein
VLRKRDSPALVTGMAWEERRGNRYYYRSVRDGERVRKEYVGAGEVTEALARADETIRCIRELEAAERRAEVERLAQLDAPVAQLYEMVEVLARAELVVAGYYRHKGQWRFRRERSEPDA